MARAMMTTPAIMPAVYPAWDVASAGSQAVFTAYSSAKLRPAPRLKAPAFRPGRKPGFSRGDRTMPSPLRTMFATPA